MTATEVQTVVVGGGVVGLAAARALALIGQDVLLLERHGGVGRETSSRSSEVIHAGLYYPPGSLRARLCVEGRQRLYDFAREAGVPHRACGKLVVATTEDERARLDALAANAVASGVDDLAVLTPQDVRQLEPELPCAAALLSPSTGVIDSHALMVALEGHLRSLGGQVVFHHEVTGIAADAASMFRFSVQSADGRPAAITARNLVIAGGLGATSLGRMLSYGAGYSVPQTYAARGHYYALTGAAPFRHLVYPLPGEGWLGVHLTLDVTGRAKFGPDLEWQDANEPAPRYDFDGRGGERMKRFETEIRRYWPGLPDGALEPSYVGVRPKLYRQGEAVPDFAIHGVRDHGHERLVALYGIESPGLTASLAIGGLVARMLPD